MKRSEEPEGVDGGVFENDNYRPTSSYWKPWFLWVLANTVGFVLCLLPILIFILITALFMSYGASEPSPVYFIFIGAVAGSILGASQWLLFRSKIQGAGKWIGATALSWGLSFPLWFGPSIPESGMFLNALYADNSILTTIFQSSIGPVIFGAIVGFAQWLVLRQQVKHAGPWIISTIIS